MGNLLILILKMGLTAVPVILAVFLLRLCLRRAPKKYSCLLWGIVGFRLIFPFSVSSTFSIFNLDVFQNTEMGRNLVTPGQSFPKLSGYLPDTQGGALYPGLQSGGDFHQLLFGILVAVWAAGVLVFLSYFLFSWRRMRKKVEKAVWLRDNIWECEQISSPFVMGILQPKIYIPFHMDESQGILLIRHEEAHIRRKDYLVKILAYLLLAVYWFQPLVWAAYLAMERDIEMSCDEWVLESLGMDRKKDYSRLLVAFAAEESGKFMSGIPGFGGSGIRGRIRNVLNFRHTGRRTAVLLALLCILLACFFGTNARVEHPDSEKFTDTENFSAVFDGDAPSNAVFIAGKPAAGWDTGFAEKTYIMQSSRPEEESIFLPQLWITEKDRQFSFGYDALSSYMSIGTYTVEDDLLIAVTSDGKYHYQFQIIDGSTLKFIQSGSSDVSLTDEKLGIPIVDGAEFTLAEIQK